MTWFSSQCGNWLLLTWLFSKRIGDISKPSRVTFGSGAPTNFITVGKRSTVAPSYDKIISEHCMCYNCTDLYLSSLSWLNLSWPMCNTGNPLASFPCCTLATTQEPCIATPDSSCQWRTTKLFIEQNSTIIDTIILPIISSEENEGIIVYFWVFECLYNFSNSPVHLSDGITKHAPYGTIGKLLSSKLRMMCMLKGQIQKKWRTRCCREKELIGIPLWYRVLVRSLYYLHLFQWMKLQN